MNRAPALGFVILLAITSLPSAAQSTLSACRNLSLGTNGALNGFVPASGDAWHQDISAAAVDPLSSTIVATFGDLGGSYVHPDFSSLVGGAYGIPYVVVDSSLTANVPVAIGLYPLESDVTVAPVPMGAPIEGGPGACPADGNDRHLLVIDRNLCVDYEYYQAATCSGGWSASSTALWDFTITEQRPYGYTSADAAGLSVFEGLVRYDDIEAGEINHAIRFTAAHAKEDANGGLFTAPATHAAANSTATDNIMGMRLRLKAGFDVSGFSATNQVILNAMKKYGMILADNGSNLFFQGTPDARWNDNDLRALETVPATAFDVVQMGKAYDSSTEPPGAPPQIASFAASPNPVAAGTAVTLTAVVNGASYSYVDKAGFVRGPTAVVTPGATTTYTLTSRNAYGSASASTTVTVQSVAPAGFTLAAAGPTSVTVASGGTASYALLLSSTGMSGASAQLACGGAPAHSVCLVTPSTATLGAVVEDVLVTVQTASKVAAVESRPKPLGLMLLALIIPLGWARRPRPQAVVSGVLLCAVVGIAGCGSGTAVVSATGEASAGTYVLVVSATSGGVTQSVNEILIVQ